MDDPKIISVIISSIVALLVGSITFYLNLWRTRKEFQNAERKTFEELEVELVRQRIESYTVLMEGLKYLSTPELSDTPENEIKSNVNNVIKIIQLSIYGKLGLIASHETRETILRLRAKCFQYLDNELDFALVKKASWEVHQMLRSDLGLAQPNLLSAIDRLRKNRLAGTENEIETLLSKIYHNKW